MELRQIGAISYPAVDGRPTAALVLAHGAGAGQKHSFMTTAAHGLAARGIDVLTFDFPYMREGRKVPDRAPILEKAFGEAVAAARAWSSAPTLFIGGKSMGGRMATHLGAVGLDGLSGIVVFGYPLHPPGKPEQLRVQHLPLIRVPVLVIQGERDVFGSPAELQPYLDTISGAAVLHAVPAADHSLAVRGRARDQVLNHVLDATADWIGRVTMQS